MSLPPPPIRLMISATTGPDVCAREGYLFLPAFDGTAGLIDAPQLVQWRCVKSIFRDRPVPGPVGIA